MSNHVSETRASLIISSEVVSGDRIAEILELGPSKIFVKGTPTGQSDCPEHPYHIAMFTSPLGFEEGLEKHLAALLAVCEQVKSGLSALTQDCGIAVHCTYLVDHEGGWTLTQDLCRRMASLPVEYVFAVRPRPETEVT
jgi:hypothetical protein